MPQFATCYLYGGLGNQLFQIFATIAYSMEHNLDFVFKYNTQLGKRPTYWNSFLASLIEHTTENIDYSQLLELNQGTHGFVKMPPPNNNNIILNGYFQSFRFFDTYFGAITNKIRLSDMQDRLRPRINKNSISLHFRRGDYKELQGCHPILEIEYYMNALSYILTMDDEITHVYYFCENEDCVEIEETVVVHLKTEFRKCIFERHEEKTDWEEMLAMSCSKHHIIANSSFSWWGAYLNPRESKIVCYPSLWFGPLISEDTSTMFPNNWIKM
jgi:hypothetical protein